MKPRDRITFATVCHKKKEKLTQPSTSRWLKQSHSPFQVCLQLCFAARWREARWELPRQRQADRTVRGTEGWSTAVGAICHLRAAHNTVPHHPGRDAANEARADVKCGIDRRRYPSKGLVASCRDEKGWERVGKAKIQPDALPHPGVPKTSAKSAAQNQR